MCGVFILCLSGVKGVLWWPFRCHPGIRWGFIIAYYGTSLACIVGGMVSKTALGRALPMMVLFLIRFALVGARFQLGVGDSEATWRFFSVEVAPSAACHANMLKSAHNTVVPKFCSMFQVLPKRKGPQPLCICRYCDAMPGIRADYGMGHVHILSQSAQTVSRKTKTTSVNAQCFSPAPLWSFKLHHLPRRVSVLNSGQWSNTSVKHITTVAARLGSQVLKLRLLQMIRGRRIQGKAFNETADTKKQC